jgi:hypothetical protein
MTLLLFALAMSVGAVSCKLGGTEPVTDAGDADNSSDTTQSTDGSDTGNSDQASSDSDTINSFFDTIDCTGVGLDPARCEYEWCMQKQNYETDLTACTSQPSTQCLQYIECWDNYFDCLGTACPLGSSVPSSKSQIDVCKNMFTYCTLALEGS